MKYFLIETDKGNRIPYSINKNRAIDIRYANRREAYKIPNCCVVDMEVPKEVFLPDILTEPILLVDERLADVIEMYAPETIFKTIYLLNYESEWHRTYFMPFLDEVECLADETIKSRGGTELLKIVMKKEAISRKAIFRIAGFTHPYVIGRLDFVESILRRKVRGLTLEEIDVI